MRPGAGLYIYKDVYIYIIMYIVQVRFHRNNAASSLAGDCNVPQRTPAKIRSFTSIRMVHPHTHTHCRSRVGEMKMNMKWTWPWNDKLLNQNTRRGKQKRTGKKGEHQHQTPTHLAQNGKSGRTTDQTPTRGGGADGSAWHNQQGESQTYFGTRRAQTWPNTGARMR